MLKDHSRRVIERMDDQIKRQAKRIADLEEIVNRPRSTPSEEESKADPSQKERKANLAFVFGRKPASEEVQIDTSTRCDLKRCPCPDCEQVVQQRQLTNGEHARECPSRKN